MVKFGSLMLVGGIWAAEGFATCRKLAPHHGDVHCLRAFSGADSLMDKLDSVATPAPAVVEPVIEKVLEEAPAVVPSVVEKAVEVTTSVPAAADVLGGLPSVPAAADILGGLPSVPAAADILGGLPTDLPLPIIGGAVVAVVAVAFIFGGGGSGGDGSSSVDGDSGEKVASDVGTTSSSIPSDDVSVPYDAAALLAYEEAGKPGDFNTFKAKYLADTVAMIKSKQKK